ncbi:CCR4-NOT regulatory complex component [Polyrhizophydium stewartii]|uniref:CCR4-NOT regulatory complex component n=1 Tax=Polyrhizophydium stewartii TaxID=2732419 RepID=A0ABR4N1I9_9FUNG
MSSNSSSNSTTGAPADAVGTAAPHAISINHLDFGFGGPRILHDINLQLPHGSRCLLVGANGAGKSTLLRILAGKNLTKDGDVRVLGRRAFYQGTEGGTYLGTEWAHNPIVKRDVPVSRLLKSLGAERYKDRCSKLLEILDVNPDWHMHQVSDGQRRRVQIVLGLMQPWDVLLLDEVTVDLDVLVRTDLLDFLRRETEERRATIVYATHIFDGLGGWPTHVAHVVAGEIDLVRDLAQGFPELEQAVRDRLQSADGADPSAPGAAANALVYNSPLLLVVDRWLREDNKRLAREGRRDREGKVMTKWDILSENMKEHGDKYFNYWRQE